MSRHPGLLDPRQSALLVVDVQERFRTVIADFERMLAGCVRLARAFRLLGLPVLATEQYPKGLGRTVPELREAIGAESFPEKTTFSSCGAAGVLDGLAAAGSRSVLACGIEARVCVAQSVHDLIAAGLAVHVAADAVSSRRPEDRDVALERLARAGAVITTAEMAAFELLVDARHPRFKEVQALFK
jgi:nicotinamidase-related amidase